MNLDWFFFNIYQILSYDIYSTSFCSFLNYKYFKKIKKKTITSILNIKIYLFQNSYYQLSFVFCIMGIITIKIKAIVAISIKYLNKKNRKMFVCISVKI